MRRGIEIAEDHGTVAVVLRTLRRLESVTDMDEESISVLLVEDDPESGEATRTMLERRGLSVTLLRDGREALHTLPSARFDVLVADIRLGNMSGVDLLRQVREKDPEFPVILITGYDDLNSAIEAVRLGAQDYILKPLDVIEDLMVPLQSAVANHRLRIRARAELSAYQEKLRHLASELTVAEERERRRIAMGLHESIAQLLSLARAKLSVVLDKGEDMGASQAKILRDIGDWLDKAITETKTLAFDLYPPILYTVGFEAALRNLAERMSAQHGIPIEFASDAQKKPLSEDMRILLYRVAEELLANTCQHAKARRAGLSVSREDDLIRITVSDDGVGFDPATRANAGLGLFTISERLRSVGGSLEIDSAPGKGTRAMLSVALAAGKEPAAKEDRGTADGATPKRKQETRA